MFYKMFIYSISSAVIIRKFDCDDILRHYYFFTNDRRQHKNVCLTCQDSTSSPRRVNICNKLHYAEGKNSP